MLLIRIVSYSHHFRILGIRPHPLNLNLRSINFRVVVKFLRLIRYRYFRRDRPCSVEYKLYLVLI